MFTILFTTHCIGVGAFGTFFLMADRIGVGFNTVVGCGTTKPTPLWEIILRSMFWEALIIKAVIGTLIGRLNESK